MDITCKINGFFTVDQLTEITSIINKYKQATKKDLNNSIKIWGNAYLHQETFNLLHGNYDVSVDYTNNKGSIENMFIGVSLNKKS